MDLDHSDRFVYRHAFFAYSNGANDNFKGVATLSCRDCDREVSRKGAKLRQGAKGEFKTEIFLSAFFLSLRLCVKTIHTN